MKLLNKNIIALSIVNIFIITSCYKNADSPGYEYVPDMYRSQAIEAYVDYGLVADVEHSKLKNTISARIPAEGTIKYQKDKENIELNLPYPFTADITDEERKRAAVESFIPTKYIETLETAEYNAKEGKELFETFCIHCHGKTGQGDGPVITKGGFLSTPPSYSSKLNDRTLGSIFYTITYGQRMMGPLASQVNKEERWKLALYVRKLQNKGDIKFNEIRRKVSIVEAIKNLDYSQEEIDILLKAHALDSIENNEH
jgi:mono/diheme cytochrome c family protein